jgi:hypothetical protein
MADREAFVLCIGVLHGVFRVTDTDTSWGRIVGEEFHTYMSWTYPGGGFVYTVPAMYINVYGKKYQGL